MAITINTNLSSLIVQSALTNSTTGLNQAIERMTTGFKINGAKDNAASYSISTNMSTKISAYQVAEDNAAMGLNLLTTAGDSLSLISDHLTRIRDLITQSKNGTYGAESQKAINSEVNARVDEIERLYSTTEFNGLKLFGGTEDAGFIQKVTKRDTSAMTTLASVDENTVISSGTYSISSAEELAKLATMTNDNKITGGEFVLANDIDLSAYSTGEGWTPIGWNVAHSFNACFDGNGYTIRNLYINRPSSKNPQGLFGYISGSIKNVGLENLNVTGNDNVGGLVGWGSGSVDNCYVTGSVNGNEYIGGLVGYSFLTITNCYSAISVTGKEVAGGLVGGNDHPITNCYTTGSVVGESVIGGLVGANMDTIRTCYSTSSVVGTSSAGGFAGYKGTTIDCYYDKETSGQSDTGKGEGISSAEIKEKMEAAGLIKPSTQDENLITFQVGINSADSSQIALSTQFSIANLSGLRNVGISDGTYLETIDNILASISSKQTEYGACQNRLESALEEINTHYENLVSSRSTLRDSDIAKESSAYIRNQILQQASATLLATANQTPALALQLL